MKCKYCGITHHNTFNEEACKKCDSIVGFLDIMVSSINNRPYLGDSVPRRKLIIKEFVIEKV